MSSSSQRLVIFEVRGFPQLRQKGFGFAGRCFNHLPSGSLSRQERNCRNVVFGETYKSFVYGAGDGTRTRDVQLGKLAFYH